MDELTRRYSNVREALARDGLDAAIVCGSEYTGFEGAVTYMSGFTIVHRYAYVLLPLEGERRSSSRPRRATSASTATRGSSSRSSSTGRASGSPIVCAGKRVGVYGLDYVMTVRDFAALAAMPPSSSRGTSSSTTRAR